MASKKLSKRKSPCQDTIFLEVNDNDLSPEPHNHEDSEPEIKTMKIDTSTAVLVDKPVQLSDLTETSIVDQHLPTNFASSCEDPESVSCKDSIANSKDVKEVPIKTESKELKDGEMNGVFLNKENITHSNIPGDDEISISFGNKQLADSYKFKFITFLKSFVELEIVKETDLCITIQSDPLFNSSEWIVLDETLCSNQGSQESTCVTLSGSPSKSRKKKAKKKKKEEDLFVLDTNPSQNEPSSLNTKYLSKFQIDIEEKDEDDTPKRVLIQTCFNCNENHSLKDCPVPKVQARINAARNKFKAQKQTT